MPAGIVAELAIAESNGCPVATASADTGASISSVTRAQATAEDGTVAEEFHLPADADRPTGEYDVVASFADEDRYRFNREKDAPCVCEAVEHIAGPVSNVSAREGTLYVTVHAREAETVRDTVTELKTQFGCVRVVRLRRAGDGDDDDLVLVDRAALTDRQREVLETAHEMGYFAYPKGANAGEVADALDVSPSTFSEHLAAAQSKLLDALLTE